MRDELPPSWRKSVSATFAIGVAAICIRYMLIMERLPNYQRILSWWAAWWQ